MLKELFQAGGWGMFPILLFGVLSLGTAAYFALRVDERTRGFVEQLNRALFWFIVVAFATDLIAVCSNVARIPIDSPMQMSRIVLMGIGESLSPVVMGPAFLGLTHVLLAIGQRRLDARRA